jgi:hypothetical protein
MLACPNSTESGCRCVEHDPGLSAHAKDATAYAEALATLTPEPGARTLLDEVLAELGTPGVNSV